MPQINAQGTADFASPREDCGTNCERIAATPPPESLAEQDVAASILHAPPASVTALGGIDGERLQVLLQDVVPAPEGRLALILRMVSAPTTEAFVDQVIDVLADTARRLWPIWFTDVSFGDCRNDAPGQVVAGWIARRARVPGLSSSWADAAARLALAGRSPRIAGVMPATEISQLALAIRRSGIVLVVEMAGIRNCPNMDAVVRALEWIARHSRAAVIALFPKLPSNEPPFDRILYAARLANTAEPVAPSLDADHGTAGSGVSFWLAPWRGQPHPLSVTEQRLAKALGADPELASLFGFNQAIDTLRGSRPRVDLVWPQGRLVVELDGYETHGNRAAFMYDRHRDYELTLSGYTVLRLANDEITRDIAGTIEKIRDLVRLCRARAIAEARHGTE